MIVLYAQLLTQSHALNFMKNHTLCHLLNPHNYEINPNGTKLNVTQAKGRRDYRSRPTHDHAVSKIYIKAITFVSFI